MKKILLASVALLLVAAAPADAKPQRYRVASAAVAKPIPIPKPLPVQKDWENWDKERPVMIAQAQRNPDPFNVQNVPQQPVVVQPPAVNVQVPEGQGGPLQWILVGLMGLLTVLFGGKTAMDMRSPKFDVGSLIKDPQFKEFLAGIVESGVPGRLIQTFGSQIPVIGPWVNILEPRLRTEVIERLRQQGAQMDPSMIPAPQQTQFPFDLDDFFKKLDAKIDEGFKKRGM